MTNKKLAVTLSVFALSLIAIGAFLIFGSNETNAPSLTNTNDFSEQQQPQANKSDSSNISNNRESLTIEEVATHATADDCWTIIDDKVYDITSYISSHPGGNDILAACGKDGSTLFNQRKDQAGNSVGSGQPHSSRAQSTLEEFYIGDLSS
jgi:cytochrome b involved in lipid metabolism